ncbi:iron-containing redox enzyme family protein [Aetokthonos hydrillicola Thurmond2011]|uniref:Iron-containing redox enzyme family protein n=1 Tax=Aetokthonos hydrillicola Thurmond2011 TaxID=2712845 RepID=A0AAP5MC02_9CYAN|nr:iron-containing redox enzyme family protein [Aetokthonos hydrillicola]MBO3461072.1 iron-containing redox enzyme family protein [Aetokthonos hydrillicola CCALA 1050]MBW4586326.1 iron-containing redox enzyme family protein [Aetokthonos hydrillicola CCALA 1050]MDR9897454.1 iron-containing redox enzyme family protein [Aetokthonos hydrillicola Thurmond2011]
MISRDEFWMMADEARLETEYLADEKLHYLQRASLETLQRICLQYRYFTKEFPNNLGILIAKLPYGKLKSLLAEILAEELGEGEEKKAHLKLWDNFLISIGISDSVFESSINSENKALLEEIKQLTISQSPAYAVGLCGMGGECLCQIYLSTMYKNLIQNPYIQDNKANIDWEFWKFHVGEADIIHRQLVRQAINEMTDINPSCVEDLAAGYQKAKHKWDTFWNNVYTAAHIAEKMQPVI